MVHDVETYVELHLNTVLRYGSTATNMLSSPCVLSVILGPAQETSITDRRDGAEGDDRLFKEFEAVESLSESPIITYFDPPGRLAYSIRINESTRSIANSELAALGPVNVHPGCEIMPRRHLGNRSSGGGWGATRRYWSVYLYCLRISLSKLNSDTELSCTNECPKCYNGGVCSEYTGECICAPGNCQLKSSFTQDKLKF